MAMKIAILEDNEARVAAMRACLRDKLPEYELRMFSAAEETINFLRASLGDTIVISLDHDLELVPDGPGRMVDPGSGRDVADFLARRAPGCPVVIHTTNSAAAVGMEAALQESRWKTYRVVPFNDTAWIATDWLKTMRRAILSAARLRQEGPVVNKGRT
jgi:hypothetical protein